VKHTLPQGRVLYSLQPAEQHLMCPETPAYNHHVDLSSPATTTVMKLTAQMTLLVTVKKTSASAGLQDANPTIQPYEMLPPQFRLPNQATAFNFDCPLSLVGSHYVAPVQRSIHPRSNAAAMTPREPKFTKMGEAHRGQYPNTRAKFHAATSFRR